MAVESSSAAMETKCPSLIRTCSLAPLWAPDEESNRLGRLIHRQRVPEGQATDRRPMDRKGQWTEWVDRQRGARDRYGYHNRRKLLCIKMQYTLNKDICC